MDVIPNGADEKIIVMNVHGWSLHIGKSIDGGRHIDMRQEPILQPTWESGTSSPLSDSAWDASGQYRPTGIMIDRNGERVLDLFYGGVQGQVYHTGRTTVWEMKPATLDFLTVAGRRTAPTDSVTLTFPNWTDSSNGRMELFVDSTSAASKVDYVKLSAYTNGLFIGDTLVIVYKTTVAATGDAATAHVKIDAISMYGPDLSSSSSKPDSLWWTSATDRAIDTMQTLKINIKTRDNGGSWDGALPFVFQSGSQITLVLTVALTSDEAALHVERAYIAGRRR
jgi:hypothetical protein